MYLRWTLMSINKPMKKEVDEGLTTEATVVYWKTQEREGEKGGYNLKCNPGCHCFYSKPQHIPNLSFKYGHKSFTCVHCNLPPLIREALLGFFLFFWATAKFLFFLLLPKGTSRNKSGAHMLLLFLLVLLPPSPSLSAATELRPGADPLRGQEDPVRHHPQGQRPCWPRQVQDPAADPPGPDQAEDRRVWGHVGDQDVSPPSLSVAVTHSQLCLPHAYLIGYNFCRVALLSTFPTPLCLRMELLLCANCTK